MPRNIALTALNNRENILGFQERTLEGAFDNNPRLDQRDRAFSLHLVQGVLRWQIRIDWIIKQSVRFPFANIELPILNILRLAVYQIFLMDRVPESAAVNEAVKQAGKLPKKNLRGVVNGILRNICRKKGEMVFPDADRDPALYLAITYAYPMWLVKQWIREHGVGEAEKMLRAGNDIPRLFIRTNTLGTTREKLLEILREEGIDCSLDLRCPEAIEIARLKGPLHKLQAFHQGLFQVQSRPAQICSHLLFPESGESVLDVCAGFGGKSTHMAALMKDRGFILGVDTNRERIQGLIHSTGRLGIGTIMPIIADATRSLHRLLKRPFQKILVDAPCSGLGVIS
ncbi:MAG TPA: 16S rRNA (cytosine(967)-C(5))-methyltransferase RsmB, partial [Deltaproteobacteria bacterium]|nr:16S rRNA (cytosine(967)-C(5))-methyltransferase RsmB [Deltaproteobacteria bacterium]